MECADATELARLVEEGKVTSTELVQNAIDRVESVNLRINAVITKMYDEAKRNAGTLNGGPFNGVPFLLKDLIAAYEGVPMSFGSELTEDYVPDHDSFLVERYKDAGLIVLGKTNTPEFGITPTTEPDVFGPCRNPWDPDRIAGGSSGGSAAAVASGIVPAAHGNDGGGSLRIPAACCGVFGLKPTRGRGTLGPDFGEMMGGLVVEHAITRSVRDSAALLDVARGSASGDPYEIPSPDKPYREIVREEPDDLTVGLWIDPPLETQLHSDCRNATEQAAELCEDLGHQVKEVSPEVDSELMQDAFMTVWAAGTASAVEAAAFESGNEVTPEDVEPLTWMLLEMGRDFSASDYLMSLTYLHRVSRELQQEYFDEFDVLLSPTLTEPPVEIGSLKNPEEPMVGFEKASLLVPFTPIFNITGQPAMSVPLYWNDDDLPIGIHFGAGFGREDVLFRLASQLEEARPWMDRLPSINAID